jgi:mannose/fructose/N-acetylgalactosamine-specific phosphotransferase system component IID
MVEKNAPSPLLGGKTLWAVAFRTLFLEASWNFVGQQNLGFAAAVNPALRRIYQGRPADLAASQRRVLTFFNTNPVISGLVIGAALKVEEEKAKGLIDDERGTELVNVLASSMANHGDLLFWQSWLPFCCLLGFGLTWFSAATGQLTWTPLLIPVLYCALAWPTRVGGVFLGYRLGRKAHLAVGKYRVVPVAHAIQKVSAFLIGFLTCRSVRLMPETATSPQKAFFLAVFLVVLIPVLAQRVWPGLGPKTLFLLLVLGLGLTLVITN